MFLLLLLSLISSSPHLGKIVHPAKNSVNSSTSASELDVKHCTLSTSHLYSIWFTEDTSQTYDLIGKSCQSDNCAGTLKNVAIASGFISQYKADIHYEYFGLKKELDEVIRTLQGVLDKDPKIQNHHGNLMRFYKHVEIKCGQVPKLKVEIKIRHVFI